MPAAVSDLPPRNGPIMRYFIPLNSLSSGLPDSLSDGGFSLDAFSVDDGADCVGLTAFDCRSGLVCANATLCTQPATMANTNGNHQAIADFTDLFPQNVSSVGMFELLPRYIWTADVVNDAQVKCNKSPHTAARRAVSFSRVFDVRPRFPSVFPHRPSDSTSQVLPTFGQSPPQPPDV